MSEDWEKYYSTFSIFIPHETICNTSTQTFSPASTFYYCARVRMRVRARACARTQSRVCVCACVRVCVCVCVCDISFNFSCIQYLVITYYFYAIVAQTNCKPILKIVFSSVLFIISIFNLLWTKFINNITQDKCSNKELPCGHIKTW